MMDPETIEQMGEIGAEYGVELIEGLAEVLEPIDMQEMVNAYRARHESQAPPSVDSPAADETTMSSSLVSQDDPSPPAL